MSRFLRTHQRIRKLTRILTLRIVTLPLLLLLVVGAAMSITSATVSDLELTEDNMFNATTLDMSLRSTVFDPATALEAGDQAQRSVFVQNVGELPFKYSQAYQFLSGDTALCDALQLRVDYQYYNNSGVLQTVNKYNGALSGFSLNTAGTDADLVNPNSRGFSANSDYQENEQWFVYTVSLPTGADSSLQNLTCGYNLVARAWQQDFATYPQGFNDEEILANTITSGEWYLPAPVNQGWNVPTLSTTPNEQPLDLTCGSTTNGGNPTAPRIAQNWSSVAHPDVRYQRRVVFPNGTTTGYFYETNNYTPFVSFGSGAGIQGTWQTQVRAFVDRNSSGGNNVDEGIDLVSAWSNTCNITLDTTAPTTTATVTNSPVRPVEERIINGGFETGNTNGWTVGAGSEVAILSTDSVDGVNVSPHSGTKMAKIGHSTDPGNDVQVNIVSQAIPKGIRSVGFYYNFFTKDVKSFDEPGMMVYINDKQVQQIWAGDVNTDLASGNIHSTGWQHMNIYVGDVEDATLSIAFYSGNTGDANDQSWLYLDDASTLDMVVNGAAKFDLHANEAATTYYQLGSNGSAQTGTSFSLAAQPTDGVVKYWSVDGAGNKENDHIFYAHFDNLAPSSIADLSAKDEADGEYTLTFTAPSDDKYPAVSEYDIRYSTSEISASTDWNTLAKPDRVAATDTLPGTIRAPRKAGSAETIVLTGLTTGQQYYFAIKSLDSAKNISDLSNIASVNLGKTASTTVVLNEILYNPTGDDDDSMPNGEWVELFNNAATDLDVNNWYLTDSTGTKVLITSANSDNNLNTTDGGETIVPAGGRLVVYRNGAALFDNTGDTVTLYDNSDVKIDERTYTGGKVEGNSEARIPEGIGGWIDPIATPGTPNAQTVTDLISQVKLWQQDPYNAKFALIDAQAYDSATYVVTYTHNYESSDVREAVQGSINISNRSRVNVENIYMATCSEGGAVCVPHAGVKLVGIEVELKKADGSTKVLKYDYPNTWNQ